MQFPPYLQVMQEAASLNLRRTHLTSRTDTICFDGREYVPVRDLLSSFEYAGHILVAYEMGESRVRSTDVGPEGSIGRDS